MHLEVVRNELQRVRLCSPEPRALADGEARLRVDRFGLTSNNITYAVFGEAMKYWDFFPAEPADAGDPVVWGRVPVWGFGEVLETRSPQLDVGERLYGYFPMGSELVVQPGRGDERGVVDTAAHRAGLAAAYNRYLRCAADPAYRADREALQMLLFPLFFTSFVVDDFSDDQADFGAEQIVVSSASSKTAIGIAYQAHRRGRAVVGLTSSGNVEFVTSLGVYDQVVVYGDLVEVAAVPSVYVDVAGDADVRHAVHTWLGAGLAHSMSLGGTHWDSRPDPSLGALPGPAPAFFFAPQQIAKRSQDWGRGGLDAKVGEAWDGFAGWADGWMVLRQADGADAVTAAYLELLAGRIDPRDGHVCSLPEVSAR